jgi:hypothetical protein
MKKLHDICLITSRWVVATQVRTSLTFLKYQVSHQVGRKSRLDAALHSSFIPKEKAGKASVGVADLPGSIACKHCRRSSSSRTSSNVMF